MMFYSGQSAVLASRLNYSKILHLWDAEVKVYSQWGEDGIIDYLCEQLGVSKPKILEIGAGNFTECNSRFACQFRNASVFAVDGRLDLMHVVNTHHLRWQTHLFAENHWVTPDNAFQIESNARSKMGGIDVLSLDLDGNDYWILGSLSLESVSIVIVEYNALFGDRFAVTVPRNDNFDRSSEHWSWLYYGASIKAFIELLKNKGFQFIGTNRVGNNAFFVSDSKVDQIPLRGSTDLGIYTDWRIREARDSSGKLSFASGEERLVPILGLPLVDITTGNTLKVGDVVL